MATKVDDFLKLNPNYVGTANTENRAVAPVQQPKTASGRSGLLKWLPTALGVAGTLAAAPLTGGASLAGTAAILGGAAAAGSGLGELGAQALNKEKIDVGRIGKEALISGVTGAIPIGGAAKAAKVAGQATAEKAVLKTLEESALTSAGREVVEGVAKKGLKGKVAKAGQELISTTEGTATGSLVKGGGRVTPKLEQEFADYAKTIGTKGSPKDKLIQVAADKQATGAKIGELVQASDAPVTVGDLSRITGKVQKAGITAKNLNTETTMAYRDAIGSAKTKQQLHTIKGELDDELANFYKRVEAGSATKAEERVLKGYRDGINSVLKDIPGYAEANSRYATALKYEQQLLRAPKAGNVKILGIDTGIGGKAVQKGKDSAGRIMQGEIPGASMVGGSGLTSRVLREGVKQEVGGAVGNMVLPQNAQEQMTPEDAQIADQSMADAGITPDVLQQPDQVKEGLKAAALQALASGDTKGLESIVKTANLLDSLGMFETGKTSSDKPLSATAAESVAGAQAGLEGIQLLREEMAKDPNVRKKTVLPGRGLFGGVGNAVLGTSNYQAALGNILDSWARIKTGAAISNTEEARFQANLPEAFDPPETVEKKLKIITNLFTSVANRTGSAGTDTEAAIQGAL